MWTTYKIYPTLCTLYSVLLYGMKCALSWKNPCLYTVLLIAWKIYNTKCEAQLKIPLPQLLSEIIFYTSFQSLASLLLLVVILEFTDFEQNVIKWHAEECILMCQPKFFPGMKQKLFFTIHFFDVYIETGVMDYIIFSQNTLWL